jgi:hypothetical protein
MNPLRDDPPTLRAEAAGLISLGPAAALPLAVNLPYAITQFLDTLGIADDVPWRPTNDDTEPPF